MLFVTKVLLVLIGVKYMEIVPMRYVSWGDLLLPFVLNVFVEIMKDRLYLQRVSKERWQYIWADSIICLLIIAMIEPEFSVGVVFSLFVLLAHGFELLWVWKATGQLKEISYDPCEGCPGVNFRDDVPFPEVEEEQTE